MFGFVGASIATLIFAATCIYYLVFEGSVIAVAAQEFFGGPLDLWYAIVIAVTAPLVWKGVRTWLDRLNGWLLPFYIIGLIAVVVWALADRGYNGFLAGTEAAPGTTLPWLQCFAAYMGVWILMMFTFDFARFARPADEGTTGDHVRLGVLPLTFLLNGLIGILLVSTFDISFDELAGQESALPVEIVGLTGDPRPGAHHHHADAHQHGEPLPRVHEPAELLLAPAPEPAAHGVGRRGVRHRLLLMLTNIFSYVVDALAYQGIVIVAWVAVALAHVVYLRRHGLTAANTEFRPGRIPALNPGGILAWGIASVVGVVLKITDTDDKPVLRHVGAAADVRARRSASTRPPPIREAVLVRDAPPERPRARGRRPGEARVRCHACDRSYLAREMDRDPSAGHQAICAECGSTSGPFYHAARVEAKALADGGQAREPAGAGRE